MSNNSLNLKFILEAVDRISAPVRRMRDGMNDAFGRIKSSVGFMGFAIQYHFYHARKAINEFGERMKKIGSDISSIGKELMGKLTLPILGMGGASIRSAGQIEDLVNQFKYLTQDAAKAADIVKRLQDLKALDLSDTTAAMKGLLAAGYSVESAFRRIDFLAPIAAGSKNQLATMTDMYISLRKNGRASAEDLSAMMRANIPIAQELAKQFGVSEQRIFQMASAGMIRFSHVKKAMQDMTAEGGRFAGAMDDATNSINGTMRDFGRAITEGFAPLGREIWNTLKLGERIRALSAGIRNLVDSFVNLPQPLKSVIIHGALLAAAIGPVVFTVGLLIKGLGTLALAFGVLLSPITWVVAAVAAFGAAGYMTVKRWGKVKAFFVDMWSGIKDAFMLAISPITKMLDTLDAAMLKVGKGVMGLRRSFSDNAVTRGWERLFGDGTATGANAAAPARAAAGGLMRVDTGGKLDITVNAEGRVTDVDMRPNNRAQSVTVNTGNLAGAF